MAENNLLTRLDGLVGKYEEIELLITDPAVIADMRRFVKLNKEYKELGALMEARTRYIQLIHQLEEAKELFATESDADMREMAREEIDACESQLPTLEEEIKLLLVPADPEDDKNVIMEIRGGTGGDEAALFAGDLFKMYMKYCEQKGWRVEVSSFNEGTAGGYKEVIFSVSGEKVYGTLKYEIGRAHV